MNHLIGKKGLLASKVVVKGYQAPTCGGCGYRCNGACENNCSGSCQGGCRGTAEGHIKEDFINRTF